MYFGVKFEVLDHSRSHNSNLKGPIYNTTYTNCFPYHYTGMGSLQYLICSTLRTCGLWWSRGLTWYRRTFYRASCPRNCYMKRSTLIMVLHTITHFEGYWYLTLNPSLMHPPFKVSLSHQAYGWWRVLSKDVLGCPSTQLQVCHFDTAL